MSTKGYGVGVEDTAKTNYIFMRKQGEATAEIGKRTIKKVDAHGRIINVIVDMLSIQQREQMFGMSEQLDIIDLDKNERIILLAYLETLMYYKGQETDQQKEYYFYVKHYLGINRSSGGIDLKAVSKLNIKKNQMKAFFECVCEFLFLKHGSRSFLHDFSEELECFGFSASIIEEIVSQIERIYEFFGVQGIVEHYNIEPQVENKEEEEKKPPVIPFFEKAITIVYDEKEKHSKAWAEQLQATIHERLEGIGATRAELELVDSKKAKEEMRIFEKAKHVIFVGVPKIAKSLESNIRENWEFDKFGIKYGTSGEKTIIEVDKLKKKDYEPFIEYVKQNESRWEKNATKTISFLKQNFIKDCFDKNDPIVVNVMTTAIGWPLLLVGGVADIFSNAELKEELTKFRYFIAFEHFVSSKIDPILKKMGYTL